ncbi:hypothetical protein C8Q74DRAFT_1370544 [Fomes fomentarius]|nr:hypothetical protein C8Q74DRAFT_1370544 [Fomes fomentarius]
MVSDDESKMQVDQAATPPRPLCQVAPRHLTRCTSALELATAMLDGITAHQRLLCEAGTLHGDVNINTVLLIDFPDGKTQGALVDFDKPITFK